VGVAIIALTYKKLVDRDFKILRIIEREMPRYEYVPIEVIERLTKLPSTHVQASLYKLNKLKLVKRRSGDYIGYRLTYLGLDMLALHVLVEKGFLKTLSTTTLGVGKESDVYTGETPTGELVIVKFHRVGRTSFQRVVLARAYAVDKPKISWLYFAKLAGEREYKALEELYKVGALVPKPIAYNRHVVVVKYVEGVELYRYKNPMDPEAMLVKILDTIRKAYVDVGIVHGDLSEYNVLVSVEDSEEKPYIIDWPQYVEKDYPATEQLLRRDVEYILGFFAKHYGVKLNVEKVLKFVKGEVENYL